MSSVVPIEEFLASMSPEARAMTQRLRRLIREVYPAVVERAERETSSLRYFGGERAAGCVLSLAPEGHHVLLGFEQAPGLPDPRGILAGDGAGKGRVRVAASDTFDESYFRHLMEAAFSLRRKSGYFGETNTVAP
jgi:hypothetical protein